MCGLTVDDVRSATLERPPWGKRSYDEKSVDDFLQLVARRLDVWIHRDENTALRAAAELAMSCGVDEDPLAVGHFRQGHYPAVISRYLQTSPDWHVLAVQEAPLMLDPDTFSPLS